MKTQYLQRMLIGLGLALTLAAPWASATNYYVVTSSQQPSPTPPWTNWGWAHTNLIEVVAAARDNDTIYVTNNATYWLANQITVSYAITVRSWGPGGILDPTTTILDGNYPNTTNRHFTLNNAGATVAGFTLKNGCDNWAYGGSILLQNGMVTNCTIVSNYAFAAYPRGGGGVHMEGSSGGVWNCTISGNTASNAGGGIANSAGGPWRIANCTISGNRTGYGGGLLVNPGSAGIIISNCWIVSNYAQYYSGGMDLPNYTKCYNSFIIANSGNSDTAGGIRIRGNCVLRNCLIANNVNTVGVAGGIDAWDDVAIQNCTIVSNSSVGVGGGLTVGVWYAPRLRIENTIIWGNIGSGTASNWHLGSCTNPGGAYTTNIFTNCCTAPLIVSPKATMVNAITNDPRFVSVATADFRLQSSSPCINAGVNREWMEGGWDVYGNRRIDNFRRTVDIGAYEYLNKGTLFGFQ